MFVMLERQTVIVKRFSYVFFDPCAQLRIFFLPAVQPLGQVLLGLAEITPVINPAKLLEAVIICLSRQVIQGVSQEMNIAALPNRFWQNLPYCPLKPRMVI